MKGTVTGLGGTVEKLLRIAMTRARHLSCRVMSCSGMYSNTLRALVAKPNQVFQRKQEIHRNDDTKVWDSNQGIPELLGQKYSAIGKTKE